MKDNFNLADYLKNNSLLNESIGGYVDLRPINEDDYQVDTDEEIEDDAVETADEIVSELDKPEKIYADDEEDYDDEEESMYAGRMFDLGGYQIEQGIISLLDDGFEAEDILEMCEMFINDHSEAKSSGKQFEGVGKPSHFKNTYDLGNDWWEEWSAKHANKIDILGGGDRFSLVYGKRFKDKSLNNHIFTFDAKDGTVATNLPKSFFTI